MRSGCSPEIPKQADYDVFRVLKPDEWSKDSRWIYNRCMFLEAMFEFSPAVYYNEPWLCDTQEGAYNALQRSYSTEHYALRKTHCRAFQTACDEYNKMVCESIAKGDGVPKTIPYKK